MIATRTIDDFVVENERTLSGSPVSCGAGIGVESVDVPHNLAVLTVDANHVTHATDDVCLTVVDGWCGAGFRIRALERLAVRGGVDKLAVERESVKNFLRLVFAHTRDIETVAHNNRAGIAFSNGFGFPKQLWTCLRPLLQQSFLIGKITIAVRSTEAIEMHGWLWLETLSLSSRATECHECTQCHEFN